MDVKYSEGVVSYGNITLEEVLKGGLIVPTLLTGTIVAKLPLAVGKSSWEELVGAPVRLLLEREGEDLKVAKIGHIFEERWFSLKEELELYNKFVLEARKKNEEVQEPPVEALPGPDTEREEPSYSEFWG